MSKKSIFLVTYIIAVLILGVVYSILVTIYPYEHIITPSVSLIMFIIAGVGGTIGLKIGGSGIKFRILVGIIFLAMIIQQAYVVVDTIIKYSN